jgi:hypothetical protein
MSNRDDNLTESQISTDRDTVREWARESEAKPVRHGSADELHLLPESEHGSEHERVDWDEFFEELDRNEHVVIYHGTGADRTFQVLDHDRAISQTNLSRDDIGEALMQGETVTTEVTETTVIEETIVEHADIEDLITDTISADEVEQFKPHPKIYRHAAARTGTHIDEMLHVAGPSFDVLGSQNAGMQAAWLNRGGSPWDTFAGTDPDLTGETFHDIADALDV